MTDIESFDPHQVLGVPPGSDAATVRKAYLARVRENPPESEPELFERIRAAYDRIRGTYSPEGAFLDCLDPSAPLEAALAELRTDRTFVGPRPWIDAIREASR